MSFPPSLAVILFMPLLSAGCTVVAGRYTNSVDSQVTLRDAKEKSAKSVSVGRFTDSGLGESNQDIGCRGTSIRPQQTFTDYIRSAVVDELRLAGLYDETSSIKVIANLSQLKLSTTGDSSWTIVAAFSVDGATYTSTVEHAFTSSFDGAVACQNAGQAFPVAVQKLVSQFFMSREFTNAVAATKAEPPKPAAKPAPKQKR